MIQKLLNSQSKSITGAAALISLATLASRIIGLLRDRVFVHYFGATHIADAYQAAFRIPDLLYNLLIVGALTAGFIPTFTKLFYKKDTKSEAWRLCNNIINSIAVVLVVICGLGMLFAPTVTRLIAPGFMGDTRTLLVLFTRIMLCSPIILGISMVLGGILQSLRQFLLYAIAPIFYNVGIIIGILFLVKPLGASGLAWGVVLGASLHCLLQLYGAHASGYRWQWHLNWGDRNLRTVFKLMLPRTLGIAISQINIIMVTILASYLSTGSVAVYEYADNLQAVPTGIIAIPFALAVFPMLSTMVAENNEEGFISHLAGTTRQILFLILPCAALLLLLRAQIVRVVYGSGVFDWTATIATANTLAFFALGLFAQALIPLFARAFYALSNTKTPFVIGIIAEIISIISALLLMRPLGVAGLALASSIGATVNCIVLFLALKHTARRLEEEKIFSSLLRTIIALVGLALTVQLLKYPLAHLFDQRYLWGILSQGLVAGILGILVYAGLCWLLKVEEMLLLQQSLKKRWLKLWNVPVGIDEAETL